MHRRHESLSVTLHEDQLVQVVLVRIDRGVNVGGELWLTLDAVPWLAEALDRCLDTLQRVPAPHTLWSGVYDMSTGGIQVVMAKRYDQMHAFQLEMKEAAPR